MRIQDQIPRGSPRYGVPIEDDELHAILTIISPDGLLVATGAPDEKWETQARAFADGLGDIGCGQTMIVSTDKPVILDCKETFDMFNSLFACPVARFTYA